MAKQRKSVDNVGAPKLAAFACSFETSYVASIFDKRKGISVSDRTIHFLALLFIFSASFIHQ